MLEKAHKIFTRYKNNISEHKPEYDILILKRAKLQVKQK